MAVGEPFHEGEVAVQERTGERAIALRHGAMIRDTITPQARAFLASQRTVAVGAVDELGRPWASLFLGEAGLVTSDDGCSVRVRRDRYIPAADDPLQRSMLRVGRHIGMLAIDLASRRRLRINGVLTATTDQHLELAVREAFPNCPKYIQLREWVDARPSTPRASEQGVSLDAERHSLIERVDTLFVASHHPARGVDVSHRGGAQGFVRVADQRTLRIPDYAGNSMFQTLGNFAVEPRAGVVLVDFEGGRFLSLTGKVSVSYGAEDRDQPTGGTGRYWELSVDEWHDFATPGGPRFRLVESSPFNP